MAQMRRVQNLVKVSQNIQNLLSVKTREISEKTENRAPSDQNSCCSLFPGNISSRVKNSYCSGIGFESFSLRCFEVIIHGHSQSRTDGLTFRKRYHIILKRPLIHSSLIDVTDSLSSCSSCIIKCSEAHNNKAYQAENWRTRRRRKRQSSSRWRRLERSWERKMTTGQWSGASCFCR